MGGVMKLFYRPNIGWSIQEIPEEKTITPHAAKKWQKSIVSLYEDAKQILATARKEKCEHNWQYGEDFEGYITIHS